MNIEKLKRGLTPPQLRDIFLPNGLYSLLMMCDGGEFSEDEILQRITNYLSNKELLTDPKKRSALLASMRPEEALELGQELGLDVTQADCFDKLERWSKKVKQEQLGDLFRFFNLNFDAKEVQPNCPQNEPTSKLVDPNYGLFEYQKRGMFEVIQRWNTGHKRVLLHMPTGSGKTRTAMSIVCNRLSNNDKKLVIWLANSKELCQQAASEFIRSWKNLGNYPVKVYVHTGDEKVDIDNIDEGFLSITLQSANNLVKNSPNLIKKFRNTSPLVVFDEAHLSIAPTYRDVMDSLVPKISEIGLHPLLLGLTATPGRASEEESEILAREFERNIVEIKGPNGEPIIQYLLKEKYLANPKFKTITVPFNIASNFLKSEHKPADYKFLKRDEKRLLNYIANDQQRNLFIIKYIVEHVLPSKLRIIFFAASVEQAELINSFLNIWSGKRISEVVTAVSQDRNKAIDWFREKAVEGAPRVLCNYGVLTTGFDAPEIDAVIIGRPVSNLVLYSQMVGRGLRGPRSHGTEEVEIIRIRDNGLPEFVDLGQAFNNWNNNWRRS